MKKTFSKLTNKQSKIIIATVGLADPTESNNVDNIRKHMEKQLPSDILKRADIIHLRGGIDYSSLNFKHRTMMSLLYKKILNMPEEEKTPEIEAIIETYNKKVDFKDLSRLKEIVDLM